MKPPVARLAVADEGLTAREELAVELRGLPIGVLAVAGEAVSPAVRTDGAGRPVAAPQAWLASRALRAQWKQRAPLAWWRLVRPGLRVLPPEWLPAGRLQWRV